MKQCPKCHREYPDESMRFCLDDGSLLSTRNDPDPTQYLRTNATGASPTEILQETPTRDAFAETQRPSERPPVQSTIVSPFAPNLLQREALTFPAERKSNRLPLIIVGLGALIIFGILVVIIIINRSSKQSSVSSLEKFEDKYVAGEHKPDIFNPLTLIVEVKANGEILIQEERIIDVQGLESRLKQIFQDRGQVGESEKSVWFVADPQADRRAVGAVIKAIESAGASPIKRLTAEAYREILTARDVTGTWRIVQTTADGGQYTGTLKITQTGSKLSGRAEWDDHREGSISGRKQGPAVRIVITYSGGLVGTYDAEVNGGRMVKGKAYSNQSSGTVDWNATRQ